jgi:hypothetical protein
MCETCHEDYELPIAAKQCPICAGQITRLYDQVNVATGLATSKAVDRLTQPVADAKDKIESHRETREQQERELKDRVEQAVPQMNSRGVFQGISAPQAMGMVDAAGRMASRTATSILFGRKISHTKVRD